MKRPQGVLNVERKEKVEIVFVTLSGRICTMINYKNLFVKHSYCETVLVEFIYLFTSIRIKETLGVE